MDQSDHECDVVVIGAGMAGLAAARRLHGAGLRTLVVEARGRVGGRSWTDTTGAGFRVDRGGQWIGPTQNHLQALADELGVSTFPTHTQGESVEWRDGARHTYTGLIPTSDPEAAAEGIEAILELDIAALEIPLDAPWTADGADQMDSETLATFVRRTVKSPAARNTLAVAVQAVFGAEPHELSLLFTLFYLHSGGGLSRLVRTTGGAQERRFDGGSQQLAVGMARALGDGVLLGAPVTSIEYGPDHVEVTCTRAQQPPPETEHPERPTMAHQREDDPSGQRSLRIRARRVVVAMPPALSARLCWSPPLPGARDQLAQRMPMGSVTKIHALYDRPFWRDEGLNGQLVSDSGALGSTFDDSPADGSHGALVGFIAGHQSRRLETVGPGERRRLVLHELSRAFGPRAMEPIEVVEQHWAAEEYTRGGPVAISVPGALTGFGPALRRPVGPIHWAGTETATEWCGYLDGALSSGVRAADEVLAELGRGPGARSDRAPSDSGQPDQKEPDNGQL